MKMACEMICDGCGKREKAVEGNRCFWKPDDWFQRRMSDGEEIQLACCEECIKIIEERAKQTLLLQALGLHRRLNGKNTTRENEIKQ